MKRFLLYIILFLTFIFALANQAFAENMPLKVTGLNYDTFASSVIIHTQNPNNIADLQSTQKYVRLSNPNRIYFDIDNAVLIGEKQQIVFENSKIKEINFLDYKDKTFIFDMFRCLKKEMVEGKELKKSCKRELTEISLYLC